MQGGAEPNQQDQERRQPDPAFEQLIQFRKYIQEAKKYDRHIREQREKNFHNPKKSFQKDKKRY